VNGKISRKIEMKDEEERRVATYRHIQKENSAISGAYIDRI